MANRIHIGDYGHTVQLETGLDLTFASSVKVLIVKPDGTQLEKTGSVSGTKVTYTVEENVFDQRGTYVFYSQAIAGNGKWTGDPHEERVYEIGEGD